MEVRGTSRYSNSASNRYEPATGRQFSNWGAYVDDLAARSAAWSSSTFPLERKIRKATTLPVADKRTSTLVSPVIPSSRAACGSSSSATFSAVAATFGTAQDGVGLTVPAAGGAVREPEATVAGPAGGAGVPATTTSPSTRREERRR